MNYLEELGFKAKKASKVIGVCDTNTKNELLKEIAKLLLENSSYIVEENKKDIENAKANNMKESLIDRLMLDENRIEGI